LPYRIDRGFAAVGQHLVVDAVGRAAQGQLAQGDQVALAEEVADRPFRLLRQIDLALLQALQQFVGRQIDQYHFVGIVEDTVGYRLPDANAGDAADHIVERFQMLHIDRAVDVDAGGEQLMHVLPAFGMARAGDVGMGQFVHQDQRRTARQCAVEIELPEHLVAIGNRNLGSRSRPASRASVSLRPCVSTTPMTTSVPSSFC
jgi:hypothetical protein